MEFWYVWVIPLVGGLLWFIISQALVKAPGTVLQTKFIQLGTLSGKSLSEITTKCGAPNSVSATGDGKKVCQWMATGYHIVLLFDENDICLGVSNETKV